MKLINKIGLVIYCVLYGIGLVFTLCAAFVSGFRASWRKRKERREVFGRAKERLANAQTPNVHAASTNPSDWQVGCEPQSGFVRGTYSLHKSTIEDAFDEMAGEEFDYER